MGRAVEDITFMQAYVLLFEKLFVLSDLLLDFVALLLDYEHCRRPFYLN